MLYIPSIYSHIVNGILTTFFILLVTMNFSKIKQLDFYRLAMLVGLSSVLFGIHAISHLGLEYVYGYNPLLLIGIK